MTRDPLDYGLSALWVYCADDGGSCMAPAGADLYTGNVGGGFTWPSAGGGTDSTPCDMSTSYMGFDFYGLITPTSTFPYACFYLPRSVVSQVTSGPDPYDDMTTTCSVSPCVIVHQFATPVQTFTGADLVALGITPSSVAFVFSWGLASVLGLFMLGYAIGVATGVIRKV